jgi:formylglycine-generating enzyme required for sulfatase activity
VLRRRLTGGAVTALVVGAVLVAVSASGRRRREIARQVGEYVSLANTGLRQASSHGEEAATLRSRAFVAFDKLDQENGESIWAKSLAEWRAANAAFEQAVKNLEAAEAIAHDPAVRRQLADALLQQAKSDNPSIARPELLRRLRAYDDDGTRVRELDRPGTLGFDTTPSGLEASLVRYDSQTHRLLEGPRPVGHTPLELALPPGSYRLSIEGNSTTAAFYYPFELSAGAKASASLAAPARAAVPAGFIYAPPGPFLFGESDEEVRTGFVHTVPLHEVMSDGFIIARNETTFAEWIEFLEDQPRRVAAGLTPQAAAPGLRGSVDLTREHDGHWEISITPVSTTFRANAGEMIKYPQRTTAQLQDWLKMPVVGVSRQDIERYLEWKQTKHHLGGARLCTEKEWERAARGADARIYPHGDQLNAGDANFDETYGKKPGAYGLDEVGSHSRSASPFGVEDLAGNAFELVQSSLNRDETVARGGAFYYYRDTERATNREIVEPTMRNHMVGFRVCASL